MHNHANKQHHSKLCFALFAPNSPAGFEDHGENEGIHSQHEHWVEEGPSQAHGRAFIAPHHFALGHLRDELGVRQRLLTSATRDVG